MSSNSNHQGQIGRPGSMSETGERIFQYPAAVKGFFRTWRTRVYLILIAVFLILPWVKVGGYQSILINIPERKFAFFGLHFWAHDTPLIFFILAFLTLALAFVTALWGRVWCGWACPQTVFIDGVFRKIETWIEGSHLARRKLDEADWNFDKIKKRFSKWAAFFAVSFFISHSFVAYFVGAENVVSYVQGSPSEHWTTFLFVMALTAIILFDFGWFREQFCIIMCPYGRFQSVLMDEKSMAVVYDEDRGEPRRGVAASKEVQGDCIDCGICVRACPTGIDIRDGVQMECIACTACIDGCDEVMEKIKKPKGLIRYDSELGLKAKGKVSRWGPRAFIYLGLLLFSVVGLAFNIQNRQPLDVQFIRATEAPYKLVKSDAGQEQVLNHFKIHAQNQSFELMLVDVALGDVEGVEVVKPELPVQVNPGSKQRKHIFIKFSRDALDGSGGKKLPVIVKYRVKDKYHSLNKEIQLIGPIQ